jgi:predicted GIY-YIG superfamily endonuclease
MKKDKKPYGYWTKEKCMLECKKYKTLNDLINNNFSVYNKISKNDWQIDCYKHFETHGNLHNRCIYVYEFENKTVYVGLTYNINVRKNQHKNNNKSEVFKYIKKTNLIPIFKKLTDYLPIEKAKIKEKEYIKDYIKNKWQILNKTNGGEIGGKIIIWTKNKCLKEALKYKTKNEYIEKSSSYFTAYRNGWLDEICSHMEELRKPNNYWNNYENCLKEAIKYKNKTDFINKSYRAHYNSLKNGWMDKICKYMNWRYTNKPKGYWNIYENCLLESKKYDNPTDFIKKSSTAYKHIIKNKWKEKLYKENKWYTYKT